MLKKVKMCVEQGEDALTCRCVLTAPSPILQCREGDLIALFNKSRDPNLEPKHLSVANLTQPCSKFSTDDTDPQFISARIPFDDCGTVVKVSELSPSLPLSHRLASFHMHIKSSSGGFAHSNF